jgi:hypothetical protein
MCVRVSVRVCVCVCQRGVRERGRERGRKQELRETPAYISFFELRNKSDPSQDAVKIQSRSRHDLAAHHWFGPDEGAFCLPTPAPKKCLACLPTLFFWPKTPKLPGYNLPVIHGDSSGELGQGHAAYSFGPPRPVGVVARRSPPPRLKLLLRSTPASLEERRL